MAVTTNESILIPSTFCHHFVETKIASVAKKFNFHATGSYARQYSLLAKWMGGEKSCHLFNSYTLTYNKHTRTHAGRQAGEQVVEWVSCSVPALKKWCKFPAASFSLSAARFPRGWFIGEVKGDEKLTLLVLAQCGLFRCVASCVAQQTHYRRIQIDTSASPPPERREQSKN